MLFGSNLLDECSEQPLNRLICLSISAQELYKRAIDPKITNTNFSYFIIDTRPQKSFNAGSISGAFNLNAETVKIKFFQILKIFIKKFLVISKIFFKEKISSKKSF